MQDVILSSRVRLARNYEDLPFRKHCLEKDTQEVVERTISAFRDFCESYVYLSMHKMEVLDRVKLVEQHLISPDLCKDEYGGVLIRSDNSVSVMINEEDHLRIQAILPGMCLQEAAELVYAADDGLQNTIKFAYDQQLGFLTACPTNTGTGMRASYMLHLPLLSLFKQIGAVTQLAAKLGLTLRGIYGEGSQAEGNIYQLSNQVTLGRTENEIMEAVTAVARQVIDMEAMLRQKVDAKGDVVISDLVFRSYGLLKYARRMPVKEFMLHWSNLRLGATLNWIPVSLELTDKILTQAQPAHVQLRAGKALEGQSLDEARAMQVRAELEGGS
jgi:protein arginine kinase